MGFTVSHITHTDDGDVHWMVLSIPGLNHNRVNFDRVPGYIGTMEIKIGMKFKVVVMGNMECDPLFEVVELKGKKLKAKNLSFPNFPLETFRQDEDGNYFTTEKWVGKKTVKWVV